MAPLRSGGGLGAAESCRLDEVNGSWRYFATNSVRERTHDGLANGKQGKGDWFILKPGPIF